MGEEVVASYTSGVPRMKGYILAEFLFLTVIYVSILVGLKDTVGCGLVAGSLV